MLMPHPAVLRKLVDEYEALRESGAGDRHPQARDLAYTLCVSTGTRDARHALETARQWLDAASAADAAGRHTDAAGRHTDAAGRHTDDGPRVYA
ncbi:MULTISPECIES: DUF5133 domain-containing protein [unclassified Streptomyces]|uniref:DUF5133 domain-containing protein n=1 Tax=unclassified Streptomyces TaxID=2593676 RepID=UPI00070CEA80|nr:MULTISPECIES: DUF5133 domain-containing protein [unclassified Streptomyces]KRD09435.1 hypothetical protein ASE41_31070 [Streptomyces sp. Root264]